MFFVFRFIRSIFNIAVFFMVISVSGALLSLLCHMGAIAGYEPQVKYMSLSKFNAYISGPVQKDKRRPLK